MTPIVDSCDQAQNAWNFPKIQRDAHNTHSVTPLAQRSYCMGARPRAQSLFMPRARLGIEAEQPSDVR